MSIRVNVEPTNPGQFLACCGLLELADRLWPGAEGYFRHDVFHVQTQGNLKETLTILVLDPPVEVDRVCEDVEVRPLIAPLRFSFDGGASTSLQLDGWMTVEIDRGKPVALANPPWNFWSGQQTSLRIWQALRAAVAEQLRSAEESDWPNLFTRLAQLSGRFGFDPGPAWNALDAGFSPNEQRIEVASSPAVELLAAVGLQRFRPKMTSRDRFEYATWGVPLAPTVASAAMAGIVTAPPSTRFRGRVIGRGSYAALGYSTPLTGEPHEAV